MASLISFSGLGSSIDFSKVTDAIIADRSRPIAQLQQQSAGLTTRANALKQLNTLVASFGEVADALTDRALGSGRQATSSSALVVTATGSDAAALGSINLNVTRLATRYAEASRVYASTAAPLLVGGATTATFQLRTGGATAGPVITIDSSNNTLTGLRDAINAADSSAGATIVDVTGDGSQLKLVLTSGETGAANRVQLVETTATGTGADINLASTNGLGPTPDYALLDAAFTINGLAVTRATNTVSDAVSGVTFNLQSVGSSTVNISQNTASVTDKLNAFVNAYNAVQDFIAAQYTRDATGRPVGALAGDPTLRGVQRQLRDALATSSATNGGALNSLTQLGVGRDANGKLTLDKAALGERLKNSFADVQALLSGKTDSETGLAHSIRDAANNISDSANGSVQSAIKGYETSVKSLGKSISAQLERISALRESLTRQFAAVDSAIALLNSQGTTLTNVLDSLKSNRDR